MLIFKKRVNFNRQKLSDFDFDNSASVTPHAVSRSIGLRELRSAITVMSAVKVTLPWMYSTELSNGIFFIRDRTAIVFVTPRFYWTGSSNSFTSHLVVTPAGLVILPIRNRILFSKSIEQICYRTINWFSGIG